MQLTTTIPEGYTLLKWRLTDAMMNERVKCLMPEVPKSDVRDCAINSLNFVGQFDDPDIAHFIASQKNKHKIGTKFDDFLGYLFHAYSINEFKRNDIRITYNIDDKDMRYMDSLKSMIGNGYCTLIDVFYTKRNVGHSLIAGVYKNELVAIDAQQEYVLPFNKMIEHDRDETSGHIGSIGFVYRKYGVKRTLVKSRLRRHSSSKSAVKRRRIGSRSRSRTRKTRSRSRSRTRKTRSRSRSLHGSRYGLRKSRSRSRSRDRRIHTSDIMTE